MRQNNSLKLLSVLMAIATLANCSSEKKEQGNTMCSAILEAKLGKRYNLANPIESALYFASGGPEKCAEVVASAVRIAAEIIIDKG